jgi:hypothetical protein
MSALLGHHEYGARQRQITRAIWGVGAGVGATPALADDGAEHDVPQCAQKKDKVTQSCTHTVIWGPRSPSTKGCLLIASVPHHSGGHRNFDTLVIRDPVARSHASAYFYRTRKTQRVRDLCLVF